MSNLEGWVVGVSVAALLFPSWHTSRHTWAENKLYYKKLRDGVCGTLPRVLYGPIWALFYITIAISIALFAANTDSLDRHGVWTTTWFFIILNFLFIKIWDMLFWDLKNEGLGRCLALVDAILIFVTALIVLILFTRAPTVQWAAFGFYLPFVLWSVYGTILSFAIYIGNRGETHRPIPKDPVNSLYESGHL